jgi:hypothetical protein
MTREDVGVGAALRRVALTALLGVATVWAVLAIVATIVIVLVPILPLAVAEWLFARRAQREPLVLRQARRIIERAQISA